jgi:hypothetical protein
MNCILCRKDKPLIQSHIISNFIRKACAGEEDPLTGAKRYDFSWKSPTGIRFTQDLPKPRLMCSECDSKLGQRIEKPAKEGLMPNGFTPQNPTTFAALNGRLQAEAVAQLAGKPVQMGVYLDDGSDKDSVRTIFSVLVSWRALHAMALSESNGVAARFLNSSEGTQLDNATIAYLNSADTTNYLVTLPGFVRLYVTGPDTPRFIAGSPERFPFATALLTTDSGEAVAIFVTFACWVIIWSFERDDLDIGSRPRFADIRSSCFIDWQRALKRDLQGL